MSSVDDIRRAIALRAPEQLDRAELRRAAVLVAFVAREEGGLDVLLTKRAENTRTHAGQIAFPGGGTEPGDADAIATALRETEEELGIPARAIEVLGELDPVVTSSNYAVTPIAGLLASRPDVRANTTEVAAVYFLPFERFVSEETMEIADVVEPGRTRKDVIFYRFGDVTVWGATARILKKLTGRLRSL